MSFLRPSRSDDHLSNYWNALVRNAPAEELARLARLVEPSEIAAIERARAAHARYEPDPAFARRLERTLMNTAISPIAGTIPQPHVSPPSRNGTRDPGSLPHRGTSGPRPRTRWALSPSLAIGLVVLLALASVGGVWFTTNRDDEGRRMMAPIVATPEPDASPDVPMYRGNPARTGVLPGPGIDGSPVELWSMQAGEPVNLGAAVVDGVLYIPAGSEGFEARDAMTGDLRWAFPTDAPALSAPAVVDGLGYVIDNDGTLYAVHTEDGTEAWRMANLSSRSSVAPVDGLVYAISPEGILYALEAATGAISWQSELGAEAAGGMAVADGMVYQGNAAGVITAVDVKTGEVRWTFQNAEGVGGATLTVANGQVYMTTGGEPSAMYAVNAATGDLTWRQEQGPGQGFISTTATPTLLYSVAGDGKLHALDVLTGETVWEYQLLEFVRSVPVLVEDTLYVADNGGFVRALDAKTGEQQWEYPIEGEVDLGWPVVSNGVLYIGTSFGNFYAITGSSTLDARPGGTPAAVADPSASPEASPGTSSADQISTFAWQVGGSDGTLGRPDGLAVAPDGTLWVLDVATASLLHFGADGTPLETIALNDAGAGEFNFALPSGESYGALGIDAEGNFYVLDMGNYRVVKLGPDGAYLLAWGERGSSDGQITIPDDVAVGPDGSVYVMDIGRRQVLQYTADGDFMTAFGREGEVGDRIVSPARIGVGPDGNVYVAEGPAGVKVFSPDGALVRQFGFGEIELAIDVAVDANGTAYVTDASGNQIKIFDPDGALIGIIGGPGSEPGQFEGLDAVAVDNAGGVYALDHGGKRVERFDLTFPETEATPATLQRTPTLLWETTAGTPPMGPFLRPALAPDGTIWVADGATSQFQLFSPAGDYLESWGGAGQGSGDGQFNFVRPNSGGDAFGAVAFAPDGSFYVADTGNQRIQHFSAERTFLNAWGAFGGEDGQFISPLDIAVDADGLVYVGDDRREDLQVFAADGAFIRKFGGNGQPEFQGWITLGPDGTIWGADGQQHLLHEWTGEGELLRTIPVTTGDGTPVIVGTVAFDNAGNMLVPDGDNGRLLLLDPDGALLADWDVNDPDHPITLGLPIVDEDGHVYMAGYQGVLAKYQLAPAPVATPVT